VKALLAIAAALGVLAVPASAGAAYFEEISGELREATVNGYKVSFAGTVTPTQCGTRSAPETCSFTYRVVTHPDIPLFQCRPGAWESAGEPSTERELFRETVSLSVGVTQPFEDSARIARWALWPGARQVLCLQVEQSSLQPKKECAEFFDPDLCAKELVISWENLATIQPRRERSGSAKGKKPGGNDPVPASKNCKPVLPGQPTILVYAMDCRAAREIVRGVYKKHERAKSGSWRLRMLGYSCKRDLTNSRPLICSKGKKRLESALPKTS